MSRQGTFFAFLIGLSNKIKRVKKADALALLQS